MGWLLGESTDLEQLLEAQLLSSVLLDNSSSPLQQALETTDLGQAPSPLCGPRRRHAGKWCSAVASRAASRTGPTRWKHWYWGYWTRSPARASITIAWKRCCTNWSCTSARSAATVTLRPAPYPAGAGLCQSLQRSHRRARPGPGDRPVAGENPGPGLHTPTGAPPVAGQHSPGDPGAGTGHLPLATAGRGGSAAPGGDQGRHGRTGPRRRHHPHQGAWPNVSSRWTTPAYCPG